MEYIPIDKEKIPYRFSIRLGAELFVLSIRHNDTYDFFTVDLYDSDGEILVLGEKLVCGAPLFNDLVDSRLPAPTIVPIDPAGIEDTITFENLNETVFLVVMSS